MQFQHAPAAGRLVQAVHVLRDEGEALAPALFEVHQGEMAWIRMGRTQTGAAHVVEAPNQLGIALERLRRRHVLDGVAFPQSAAAAEGGQAALGGDAGPGQRRHAPGPAQAVGGPRQRRLQIAGFDSRVHNRILFGRGGFGFRIASTRIPDRPPLHKQYAATFLPAPRRPRYDDPFAERRPGADRPRLPRSWSLLA